MVIVNVQVQKMVLSNYNRGSGDISILYTDGKERMVSKRVPMDNPDHVAAEFMRLLRHQVKEQNKPAYMEDDPIRDSIIIRFNKDEEELETKMKVFLAKINSRVKGLGGQQKGGVSYLNSWTQLKGMEFDF